jgi:hypothetical protein
VGFYGCIRFKAKESKNMQDGKKVIRYMQSKGYRVLSLNIVYLEDVKNPDTWEPSTGALNTWDDVRCVIRNNGEILMSAEASTEPGKYYTENPMNSNGAFRIAFGNYQDAWKIGKHHEQLALVQCGTLKGYRDLNKDGKRTDDKIYEGDDFGVNQHTTNNAPELVGQWSAGCLVGRYPETHAKFMEICKNMGREKFDTTVIAADDFFAWNG